MRETTTCRAKYTLISIVIGATLSVLGCDRALPTAPEDDFTLERLSSSSTAPNRTPFLGSGERPASSRENGSVSSDPPRRRGVRPTPPGEGEPKNVPTIDPSRPGPTNPTPPPSTPPPAPAPTTNKCGECDGVLRIPQQDSYVAALYAARDRVRSAVASGELRARKKVSNWNVVPTIDWQACYFWVENGFYYDKDGNRIVGACAAGMTDYAHRKIVIATQDQSRTLALVKWEATNYYLYMIGREDLLDRWQ